MGDGDTDELQRTLALVARGVQRMADSFGAVEARLGELDRLQDISDRIARLESTLASPAAVDPEVARADDVTRLVDAVRGLRDDLATSTAQLEERIAAAPAPAPPEASTPSTPAADVDRLVDAVRALRDDLASATVQLQAETTATVERAATEQGNRLAQLRDSIIAMRDAFPADGASGLDASLLAPAAAGDAEVRALVAEVRDALQAVHGEIVAGSGQLRTDLAAEQAGLRDRLVEAVAAMPPPGEERLAAIEAAVTALRADLTGRPSATATAATGPGTADDRVAIAIESLRADIGAAMSRTPGEAPSDDRFGAIEQAIAAAIDTIRADIAAATAPVDGADPLEPKLAAIEVSVRAMGGELERIGGQTTDLRTDVRRSFDRVLTSITAAEESVRGEVRAVDQRLGGIADDLRLVRGLRDGLEALAGGVDAVRQLASKSATNQQMAELGRDLTTVLAEIESARSQVLSVDQQVSHPDAIDVRPAIQKLERAVGDDVDELGKRIEQLAAAVEAQARQASAEPLPPDVTEAIAHRLRSLATGARQLGLGISEDLRSRRGKKSKR